MLLFVFDDFCTLLESLSILCKQLSFRGDARKTIWKNNNFWHCGRRLLKMYFFDEKRLIFHGKSCKKLSLKPLTFCSESSIMIKSGEWNAKDFRYFWKLAKSNSFRKIVPYPSFCRILMLAILHSRVYNRKQSSKRHCSNIQHFECCRWYQDGRCLLQKL